MSPDGMETAYMHFLILHIVEESILFCKELNLDILNVHKSNDARKLLVNAKIDDTLITLINVMHQIWKMLECDF